MLCKISNDYKTIVINNFRDLDEAKKCFPNSNVEACNEIINFSSFTEYVKDLLYKIPSKYTTKESFINQVRKLNTVVADGIKFESDDYGKDGSIIIYLPNYTYLEYEYYIDDFGDFSIGDLKDEDLY